MSPPFFLRAIINLLCFLSDIFSYSDNILTHYKKPIIILTH
nr:MAG TPA: hypothetical protein [Caudoviricetes sp.]